MITDSDHTKFFRHIALENAIKYGGKTNAKALVGKVLGTHPEYKSKMAELMKELEAVVEIVNNIPLVDQVVEVESLGATQQTRKQQDPNELKELTDAKAGNVVMRFAPSVSAPHMHIGHAITGGLTALYTKKYGGKFIFRMEDTNSDKIELEAYTNFPKEAQWAFGNVSEVVIQSDRLELYYSYAKKFIEMGHIYVCSCSSDIWKKEYADKKIDCPCRSNSIEKNLSLYNDMFDRKRLAEGSVVLRWKTKEGMSHPNPAMRDFPLMRINDTPHSKTGIKYRVWPLMNLSVFVDDVEMGMTHIIRAKEHLDNSKRQEMMYVALGKKPPVCYFTGRYNIEGLEISKTKTMQAIADGKYTGWEDIRLPYLEPMRRRGYRAGSFLAFSKAVGLSPVDKTITADDFFTLLDNYNKDIIDPVAYRYYLLKDPVQINVDGANMQKIELPLHPKLRGAGGRQFEVGADVLVEKEDLKNTKEGCLVRLMDYCNIRLTKDGWKYESESYDDFKLEPNETKSIIHWLPADENQLINIRVMMPNANLVSVTAEKNIEQAIVDDIVQFERFGFCRLDSLDSQTGERTFWFAHR